MKCQDSFTLSPPFLFSYMLLIYVNFFILQKLPFFKGDECNYNICNNSFFCLPCSNLGQRAICCFLHNWRYVNRALFICVVRQLNTVLIY